MDLSYPLFLAAGYILTAFLARRPVADFDQQLARYSTSPIGDQGAAVPPPPELVRSRDAARNALVSGALIGALLLLAWLRRWEVHWFLQAVATLYGLSILAATLSLRAVSRRLAGSAGSPAGKLVTPFDGIDASGVPGERPFDVFLSYKSEDAHTVRRVADLLLASGVRVWFAEYLLVLAKQYRLEDAARSDAAIREAIDLGVRRSRRGIVFSNDRYAGSDWCRGELESLLGPDGPGAGNLLEVRIPAEPLTHRHFPRLAHCRFTVHDGDPDRLYRWAAESFDFPLAPGFPGRAAGPAAAAARWFRDEELGYALNVAGWEITGPGGGRGPGGVTGPVLATTLGGARVKANLVIGPSAEPPRPLPAPGASQDDRELVRLSFNRAKAFANTYLTHFGDRCVGAHLLFLGGHSHLVLTYARAGLWLRRYSVVLPGPGPSGGTEYAFLFAMDGSFPLLCRHAADMDALVLSLTTEART